jgi:mannose-6-phosphate isomerase-like protein (cupin superfamily)
VGQKGLAGGQAGRICGRAGRKDGRLRPGWLASTRPAARGLRYTSGEAQKENQVKAFHGAIEKLTLENSFFRQVIYTGEHTQLVLMSLLPEEEIGDEVHGHVDQFFRIEQGEAKFIFDEKEVVIARDGEAVIVPSGTYHNVINNSKTVTLKMYTLYSPPNHPDKTIHKTKQEADAAEAAEHHA